MTEFSVRFGDDFSDFITNEVEEAFSNADLTDHINNALRWKEVDDLFDMDRYDQSSEVDELETALNAVERKVDALTNALTVLVTALAEMGIKATVKVADEPTGYTYTTAV